MNKEDVHSWIKHPEKIDDKATAELERAVQEYPFSALLQQLYLKGLQNGESYLSTSQLKKTSLWVSDRKALKLWLDGEDTGDLLEVPESKPRAKVHSEPASVVEPAEKNSLANPEPSAKEVSESAPTQSIKTVSLPTPPASKPSVPVQGKKTELGDDLSHLPPRVRAIIEKSRKIKEEYVPEESEKAISTSEEENEAESKTESGLLETAGEVAPEQIDAMPEEPSTEIPATSSQEDFEKPVDASTLSALEMVNLTDLESFDTSSVDSQEEIQEEPTPEPEERSFSRPVVLDELTGTGPDEDSDFELDFTAWLRQKERQSKQEQEEKPAQGSIGEGVTESREVFFDPNEVQVVEEEKPEAKKEEIQRELKRDLIDKFIEEQPKIKPVKFDTSSTSSTSRRSKEIDVSAMGSEVGDDFITETLAQVYVQQGHLDKAMSAYEILRLKYPEKSSFFADQILEIRRKKRNS